MKTIREYNKGNYYQVYNDMVNFIEFYKRYTITKIINDTVKKEITIYYKKVVK